MKPKYFGVITIRLPRLGHVRVLTELMVLELTAVLDGMKRLESFTESQILRIFGESKKRYLR